MNEQAYEAPEVTAVEELHGQLQSKASFIPDLDVVAK